MNDCGDVYFSCDELKGKNLGWLCFPVIYVTGFQHGGVAPGAQWIKPYAEWAELGYGTEQHVLDYTDPDFIDKLHEVMCKPPAITER